MKDSSIKEELEMWRGHGVVIASLTNEEKSKYIQDKVQGKIFSVNI
jgi:hypothetical protein